MTYAGKSMFYFSFWVFACGTGLMVFPAWSLSFLNIQLSDYIAVRLFGLVLIYLGIYYIVLSRKPACWPFFRITVFTRATALPVVCIFVLLGLAQAIVIAFVVVDALGAFWTWHALKKDREAGLLD